MARNPYREYTLSQTAHRLVTGPRMLSTNLPAVGRRASFYGWPVLTLETRTAHQTPQEERESRIVFANLNWRQMPTPPTVILRSTYWSRELARDAAEQRQADEPSPIAMPAQFVWVDLDQVRSWIQSFEYIRAPIGDRPGNDEDAPIRALRVDLSWITNMFEKRWQSRDDEHAALNTCWEAVWAEMSAASGAGATLVDPAAIHEGGLWGRRGQPQGTDQGHYPFTYDADQYDPRRLHA